MPDRWLTSDAQPARRRRQRACGEPRLVVLGFLVAIAVAVAICTLAIVAPAPAAVAPLVAVSCVAGPLLSGWGIPDALAALHGERAARRAVSELLKGLEQLPETEHPLGF